MKKLFAAALIIPIVIMGASEPATARAFKNCTELNKVYKSGVSSKKAYLNVGSYSIKIPTWNAKVYLENKKLDRDKDGIACEVAGAVLTPSPAPTPVLPESALTRALSEFQYDSARKVNNPPVFVEQSSSNFEMVELKAEYQRHLQWFETVGLKRNKELVVLIPDTVEWMNKTLAELGCKDSLPSLGSYAIWHDCRGKSVITRPNVAFAKTNNYDTINAQHELIHETFHQWNREVIVFGLGNADYPKWIHEGGAQALSRYAYFAVSNKTKTPEKILEEWFTKQRADLRLKCVGVKIRTMVPNAPWPDVANCAYSKGQVASDMIVEKYGLAKFLKLYTEPKGVGMNDFANLFKKVLGEDLEAFYDRVDAEFSSRGWN